MSVRRRSRDSIPCDFPPYRACRAVLAVLCAGSIAPVGAARLGRAARPFPDTWRTTRVFADQLPSQMTGPQWRFVASHDAGTQKMTRGWADAMRRINPRFLILHYQLAVGAGPAAFVSGDRWTNDFDRVTRHEDWFVHDDSGHRLLQPAWNWSLMDVRFNGDRPVTGFPAYWVDSAIARMRANGDDGCFADSYTQDILMGQLRPAFRWFTEVDACKRFWLPSLNRYGAYCAAAFHRQPERFYYLPNLGGMVTTWDRVTDLAVGDGGMVEGFCAGGPGQHYAVDDWKLQMTRTLGLAGQGKIVIAQSYIDPGDSDGRWFVFGSYLLTRGRQSFLNMFRKSSLEWYPEYGVELGAPLGPWPAELPSLWDAARGVYRRRFERGMVLVNPSPTPVTLDDLGAGYRRVDAVGGGAVGPDGRSTGSLTYAPVRSISIPGYSARVLLTSTVPNRPA